MSKPFEHRPYGVPAAQFLLNTPRVNLWAPPGFGKTGISLSVIEALEFAGMSEPTLIIAPKRVARDTWATESRKWSQFKHIDVVPIMGTPQERRKALRTPALVHTTNYENLEWLAAEIKGAWPWPHVIADESTRLKSFRFRGGARRARAIAPFAHKQVRRWINLTGTPSSNGLKDLWGQQWFIDGGRRLGGSFTAFADRWFKKGYDGFSMTAMPHAEAQILAALADCTMSLRVEDWFDIDKPVVREHRVTLPPAARTLYRALEKEMCVALAENTHITAVNAAVLTSKCLQVASGAVYTANETNETTWHPVHDEKLDVLESIIDECGGEQVLVAYQYKFDRDRIAKRLGAGNTADLSTEKGMFAFLRGDAQVGIAHPASLGHGVDGLQNVCRTLVYYSQDWNLENYMQIKERIGPVRQRQAGFDRAVNIHHIVADGTVEDLVMARRDGKQTVQAALMDYFKLTRAA